MIVYECDRCATSMRTEAACLLEFQRPYATISDRREAHLCRSCDDDLAEWIRDGKT